MRQRLSRDRCDRVIELVPLGRVLGYRSGVGIIRLVTQINAPIEVCFDLSRSVDVHLESAAHTNERAVAGVTSGLMNLGDTVTWEARHLGIVHRMTVKISEFARPTSFTDEQVSGPFEGFRHTHEFRSEGGTTVMSDVFELKCPFGLLGALVDPIITAYLKRFLIRRNQIIKEMAEKAAR